MMDEKTEKRFFKHVSKTETCWIWIGANTSEYGLFKVNKNTLRAPRVIWESYNGPITPGLEVCHKCDNPACVNPKHLFLGTHGDNIKDAYDKGRRQSTLKAKLTKENIKEAKYLAKLGMSLKAIGQKFGVAETTIHYNLNK